VSIDLLTQRELPERIRRFPFPFPHDRYMYSVNVEPARTVSATAAGGWGDRILEVDEFYRQDTAARQEVLDRDPSRAAQMPHLRSGVWGALHWVLTELSETYPTLMSYARTGGRCRWTNRLHQLETDFTFGDDDSLPEGPLRFLSAQVQDDLALLNPREGALWLDAGVVTFAADWSMGFDVGLPFREIHGPVPRAAALGVIDRAERFLLNLQPGEPYRRTNWTMTVDRRLDTSTESYPDWALDRSLVVADPALPDRLHLRVEVQHLVKVPTTGDLLFLIRTHLLSLRELSAVPAWRTRLAEVLRTLPQDLADYKGIARYRKAAADWLQETPTA
jgi:dimethylamine monooxygenase subunit A